MVMYDSKAPGVYIQEISGGARPIQAVGTSTAGFVGDAGSPNAPTDEAIAVNNWLEYLRKFKLDSPNETRRNEAKRAAVTAETAAKTALAAAQKAQKDAPDNASTADKKRLQKTVDDAAQALKDAQKAREEAEKAVANSTPLTNAVYGFFLNGGSRCYVVNIGSGTNANLKDGLEKLTKRDEVAIVAAPGSASYQDVIDHCENLKDRVAILDAPQTVADLDALAGESRPPSSSYAACYYPWIKVRDPLTNAMISVPPSGHMAGIWARTDAERGVHKAPANTRVRGALGLEYDLSGAEQGTLNQAGINCIRNFVGDGILVWGARTLSTDGEWRYLNVRRLFNMLEESIANSTRWIVFEPNDEPLWAAIRRDVTAFLLRIWRSGALQGATPAEAFFVKCDAETNPQENIDAGVVTTVIGLAPVKPAEFVVFQIKQYQAGTDVAIQGG